MPDSGWKEYFAFSKKQRTAVFILLAISAVSISLSFYFTPVFNSPTIDKDVQAKLNALAQPRQNTTANSNYATTDSASAPATYTSYSPIKKQQFYFDPNTLPIEGWKKLGFRDKTIANIINYREEAGQFKKPEDLYNVPRIRKKVVAAILPFVRFGTIYSSKAAVPPYNTTAAPVSTNTPYKTNYKPIDVNTAAADDFKIFPGMTDPVANRIIKFRTSIGGFNSVDDVAKTYGLNDSTFKIMRPYLTITPK